MSCEKSNNEKSSAPSVLTGSTATTDCSMHDHKGPDRHVMAASMLKFLEATGVEKYANPIDLGAASQKFTNLWTDKFLAGYHMSAAEILKHKLADGKLDSPQYVTGLTFVGMCPHDLLPFQGQAAIGYIPDRGTVGFGQLADLITCYTARLTLQETACTEIMGALEKHLSKSGSCCMLQAHHQCFATSRPAHANHIITTVATSGQFKAEPQLMAPLQPNK